MNNIILYIGLAIFILPFLSAFVETIKIYYFHKNYGQNIPFISFIKNDLPYEIMMSVKNWIIIWVGYIVAVVIYVGVTNGR